MTTVDSLSERDRQILLVERIHAGGSYALKGQAILALGLTATSYAIALNRLLDGRAALAADPVTVGRLRRLRDRFTARRPR